MMYSMESWPEAKDLDSAVKRIKSQFSDLSFESLLAKNRLHQYSEYTEEELSDREELYHRGYMLCYKYLNGRIDLKELCDLLVCIKLRSYLYIIKPFLPREIIAIHKLESDDNSDDSHDENKCRVCSLGVEMRDFVYFDIPLNKT